jgi:hypothetical protein
MTTTDTATETATLTTEDGREFTIPAWWEDRNPERFYGLDHDGEVMARHIDIDSKGDEFEMIYGLTDCCGASFKGLQGGAGCRECYKFAGGNDVPFGPVSKFVRLTVEG